MTKNAYEIFIVGTTQDGGYPHIGCDLECCQDAWKNPELKRYASSIAIVDHQNKKYFLIDVTPDLSEQLHMFYSVYGNSYSLSGIFLTHAHVGHYMGLFKLGLEMMNSNQIPLYSMPEMMKFLKKYTLNIFAIYLIILGSSILHFLVQKIVAGFIMPKGPIKHNCL